MPQIIPIKDLKNTSEISDMCHKTEEPIYVTKNGYGDMVIMSMEIYESTMRQIAMYRDIEISEKQIEAGQVKTLIKEENMSKKHKHISAMKTTEQKGSTTVTAATGTDTTEAEPAFWRKIHLHSFWEWNCWKCGKAMLTEECAWMSILRIFTVECMADVRMRLLIRLLVWRHPPMAIMLQRLTGK